MKKKFFTLLTLLALAVTGAWAETETPGNTGTSDIALVGNSYTIAGTYIAGSGGIMITPMESKGVKVRLNKNSNTLVISVNDAYRIDAMTIYACTNDNSSTNSVTSLTVDGTEKLATSITIPNKSATTAATITVSGIAATNNITLTFGGGATQGVFDFHFTYTQTAVITPEITGVSFNSTAISDGDLATLKSTKSLTIDGTSFNGIGNLNVSVSTGTVSPSKNIVGNNAVYTFTYDGDDYTVTIENIVKTFTLQGFPVYYSKDRVNVSGANTVSVIANGITFTYPSKTFQYGSSAVSISGASYQPLKLSTGEGVSVTFPTGTVATKIIVYGWSADGTGYMKTFKDGYEGSNSITTTGNTFYAVDASGNGQPSVYEYEVDNWEALYFECAGGQPFVVVDFVLATTTTLSESGLSSFSSDKALDLANLPDGLSAYKVSAADQSKVTLTAVTEAVAANTGLILEGTPSTVYAIPLAASGTDISSSNKLVATDGTSVVSDACILKDGDFHPINAGVMAAGKAYLPYTNITGGNPFAGGVRSLSIVFADDEVTAIDAVSAQHRIDEVYNLNGQRVQQPKKGLYIVNGKKAVVR